MPTILAALANSASTLSGVKLFWMSSSLVNSSILLTRASLVITLTSWLCKALRDSNKFTLKLSNALVSASKISVSFESESSLIGGIYNDFAPTVNKFNKVIYSTIGKLVLLLYRSVYLYSASLTSDSPLIL